MSSPLLRHNFPTFRRRGPVGFLRRRQMRRRRAKGWLHRTSAGPGWRRFRPRLGLPLLVKELTELAARRRTYIFRVVYALLLYGLTGLVSWQFLATAGQASPWAVLGAGHEILHNLVMVQFAGIYLFVPALMAGAIASEKENGSLVLLMLTELRPRHILAQKFLGRMMPMVTFLLLSLPLMAVVFALGGVTTSQVFMAVLFLVAASIQVGALCLLLSAFCHSTAGALMLAYPAMLAMNLAVPLGIGILELFGVTHTPRGTNFARLLWLFPPYVYEDYWRGGGAGSPLAMIIATIPTFLSAAVLLALARWAYVRRALATPRNLMLIFFRWLDRQWESANWITGGVVLARPQNRLPGDNPVAWREISTRGLSQPQYLFRILSLLETIVFIFVAFYVASSGYNYYGPRSRSPYALLLILWPITFMLIVTQAAGAMSVERSRQTLDVLLVSPMTGRDIVRQKMISLRRLLIVLAVPLLTVVLAETWWRAGWFMQAAGSTEFGFTILGVLLVLIDLSALTWVCFWIGMRSRRQGRAVLIALLVTATWCFLPLVLDQVAVLLPPLNIAYMGEPTPRYSLFPIISPIGAIMINEAGTQGNNAAWNPTLAVITHLLLCLGVLTVFRGLCLKCADRYLGRA